MVSGIVRQESWLNEYFGCIIKMKCYTNFDIHNSWEEGK